MKFTIDFSDIDIGEWVEVDEDGVTAPELSEILKKEVVSELARRLMTTIGEYIRSGALSEAVENTKSTRRNKNER